ncbi:hypothetical protein SUGI_0673950 [Cryptomeria japonica]|uniref:uncharacterized protein LOC131046471 n=1 Tax=Cryptomeria japonica TaxID=3369 RepID=UPI0024149263|nr:uncharacterized protein LOC131046471 [Cryptomeria japonica]GLJ33508.1 hypothetical protein SUGI_0673950 [Cryptomeria japonica]
MAVAALSTTFSFLKAAMNKKELLATGQAGDGREKALLNHVLTTAEKGNPLSVLNVMDAYAKTSSWFMNIGDDKGPILDKALEKYSPGIVLELGTFCGYSAVRIASQLHNEGSKLLTFEMNPDNCNIARRIIEHAGLSSKVVVVEGKFNERLELARKFLKDMNSPHFNFVFIDHWKDRYMPDYLILKENAMLGNGSGVCADNMGAIMGPADFRKYVKTHPEELETSEFKSNAEYLWWFPDSVTVSTFMLPTKLY